MIEPHRSFLPSVVSFELARSIEDAAAAIGHLNNLISQDYVGEAWRARAMWAGYARALQLQGIEIDEIDVISWGCGVQIPGRARSETLLDPYRHFAEWERQLGARDRRHWRESLPFTPVLPPSFANAPILLQAIAITGQHARSTDTLTPWLDFPLLVQRLGLTKTPLPCLVAGDKGFRLRPRETDMVISRTLRDLAFRASEAVSVAIELGRHRLRWISVLKGERKPASLAALAALSGVRPVLRPRGVSCQLGLTLSGAGKLLDRATERGLLVEVSGRLSWRIYMAPDIAYRLGLASRGRGRPVAPPTLPDHDGLHAAIADFDAEMAALMVRFPHLSKASEADYGPDSE